MASPNDQSDIPRVALFLPNGDVNYRGYLEMKHYIEERGLLPEQEVAYYQRVRAFEFPEEHLPTDDDYKLELHTMKVRQFERIDTTYTH